MVRSGWWNRARCRTVDWHVFFPPESGLAGPARLICAGCPVQADCLRWAVEHHEWGVWGGTTDDERATLRSTARQ